MSEPSSLVIIGGGNMGAALVQGLLASGGGGGVDIRVVEVQARRRAELSTMFPSIAVDETVPPCRDVVVAVKPMDVEGACRDAVANGAQRVLSIAAGVSLATLGAACGEHVEVLRAMPNTPALVGRAVSALAARGTCSAEDRAWARSLLGSVGSVFELDEAMLDAFTGLVGSGPAYLFFVAEALGEAALAEGFDNETASVLVAQLMVGATALLEREPDGAASLRQRVTSPNGTTAAGIEVLERHEVRQAFVAAVRAAARRSKELGAR